MHSGIRAIPSAPAGSDITGGINAAILRYDGAPVEEPTTDALTDPLILDEADLVVCSREFKALLFQATNFIFVSASR